MLALIWPLNVRPLVPSPVQLSRRIGVGTGAFLLSHLRSGIRMHDQAVVFVLGEGVGEKNLLGHRSPEIPSLK
jgi:hypothetical protein